MSAVVGYRGTLAERFDRLTIPEPNSGCLLWLGTVNAHGYGQMRIEHRNRPATHIALQLAGKPLPQGMRALHCCDNPFCVNEQHLFVGDQHANVLDMMRKGRQNHEGLQRGRAHNKAPLELKERARELFEFGFSQRAIARTLSISKSAVHEWAKEWRGTDEAS